VAEQLASGSKGNSNPTEKVAGLAGFLENNSLTLALRQAQMWCSDQGFDNLADVVEVGMEEDFLEVLGELKPGKRQLVLKRLRNWGK